MTRTLLVSLVVLAAACSTGADDTLATDQSLVTEGDLAFDVEAERSSGEPVLVMPKASMRNMFTLASLSFAVGRSGAELQNALCEFGFHRTGTGRCFTPGKPVETEVVEFDTEHERALYIRATAPSSAGPKEFAVLAFNGTADADNIKTNAMFDKVDAWGTSAAADKNLPGAVHAGFDHATSRLWTQATAKSIRSFLEEHHGKPGAPPLYVSGQSLGGAIATLTLGYLLFGECASIDANERFSTPRSDTRAGDLAWSLAGTSCPATSRFNVAGLYTTGSPRVGDVQFAEALANLMALRRIAHVRIVNANDIVTRIPTRGLGYSHLHLDLHGLRDGSTGFAVTEAEDADTAAGQRAATGSATCRQVEGDAAAPARCATHSLVYILPDAETVASSDITKILRLGEGAVRAIDESGGFPSLADHSLIHGYVPMLRKAAHRE